MLRGYKYRCYPTRAQADLLSKHFGCVRFVYNWALAKRIEHYKTTGKSLSRFTISADLPKMKVAEATKWLEEVNAQSLQAALRNLDCAYTRFFREKKGFPRFKAKHQKQSFQCPQRSEVDFKNGTISVVKIPGIKARLSRKFKGEVKTVTLSRTSTGKYFASILVDDGMAEPKAKSKVKASQIVGIDLGLKHFATLSTGEKIDNPKHLRWSLRKLARAQRRLSRKEKGTKNRSKQQKTVATIHEKVSSRRRDFQHKLSTRLIRENQAVALETLNVSGMQQNGRLARAINDAAWTQFVSMLEYKARWNGKTILRIGRFEPSSRLCSCGIINKELKLSDRTWTCPHCKVEHDRDILAASNIKSMALRPNNFLARGTRKFTPVETGLAGH